MSRYIVIGAGAIGALLAAQWTIARVPVVLVGRGRALEVIARDGVRVRRPGGDEVIDVDIVPSIAEAEPTLSDTVVLAVKSQDAEPRSPRSRGWSWRTASASWRTCPS